MSKSKIVGIMALIAFAMGILLMGDALAGEKYKIRIVWYFTTWNQIDVPGEEKHLMAVDEYKGISSNMEGKEFLEGAVLRGVEVLDIDVKNETGSGHGYTESTDRDGDKIYFRGEGRRIKGKFWAAVWEGRFTILRGTGKYEGIKGKGTASSYPIAPKQAYTDWEIEVELPR
jgi:hypothetical protein